MPSSNVWGSPGEREGVDEDRDAREALRRQGDDRLRAQPARRDRAVLQGRRDRVQRPEERDDRRQGRRQQPDVGDALRAAREGRDPDALSRDALGPGDALPPPRHHQDRDDRAQHRRRSLAKRTGLEEGTPIKQPIVQLHYKSGPLGDPMLNEDHVRMLKLASPTEVAWMKRTALKINAVLRPHLLKRRLLLVDFKLEFGRHGKKLMLGDEISPDTCRLWDSGSKEK